MEQTDQIQLASAICNLWKRSGEKHAFVPTMGFLHEGHLSLIDLARKHAERVSVSIFVNPSQFNNPSDLKSYPQNMERDLELLAKRGVDLVFMPHAGQMYGEGFQSWVQVEELSQPFEGAGRPGHFRGVTTVCSMLFNILTPDVAVFGEKDFQQLRVIQKMVSDLHLPLEIIPGPLVREEDGLAMSSRNVRLSEEAREKAKQISQGLFSALAKFQKGERSVENLLSICSEGLLGVPEVEIQYLSCVNEENLSEYKDQAPDGSRILTTVNVHGVRLLDNVRLAG